MSGFLKELNIIIKRKKISKNKLAAKIDVDPSSFYQMLAGKRYLNEKLFSRLISVLNLSPDEEKYLCELYQILLTGEENYYKSKAIIKFIEEFNIDEDIHPISPFKMQIGHIEEVVYGRENLKRVMFQILLNAYEKNESLKILCQPECESPQKSRLNCKKPEKSFYPRAARPSAKTSSADRKPRISRG